MDEITVIDAKLSMRLEKCERAIFAEITNVRGAHRKIAKNFLEIRDDELWRATPAHDFQMYVRDALGWDPRAVNQLVASAEALWTLEDAGLQLPINDSQARQLARLDPKYQPRVWRSVMAAAKKDNSQITVATVKRAVDEQLDDIDKDGVKVEMEEAPTFSEKAEEDLARIKKICGKKIAESIEKGTVPITEASLALWAEQSDDMMPQITEYVIKRWSVRKALNYLSQLVDGDTTVDELILMARNRKGKFSAAVDDAQVTVQILT